MKRRSIYLLLCLLLPLSAAAEEYLDEIMVSALRRDVVAADLGVAASIVGRDDLLAFAVLTDGLDLLPGTFVQQTTPGQGAVILRGLKGSSVLHAVDGVRLNNALFKDAPTPWLALVPIAAVERVEILRGAGASAYGSDAIGGVVNVVTHRPRFGSDAVAKSGDVSLSHGSADMDQNLRARIDVGNRHFAASVSVEHLQHGDRRTGGGRVVAPSAYDARGARLALSLAPSPNRDWLLDLQHYEQPETPRIDELVAGFGQVEPASAEFLFAPNRRQFAHLQHRWRGGPAGLDWTVDLAWQRIDDDRRTRAFESPERRFERNRSDLSSLSLTLRRETGAINWLAGLDLSEDRVRSERRLQNLDSGAHGELAPRFPNGATQSIAAVFAHGEVDAGSRLRINGGLRVTAVDVELPASLYNGHATIDVSDWSADAGAVLQLSERWQAALSLSKGFRAPNVFDLGTLGPRPGNRYNLPNPELASEQSEQVDIGIRYRGDQARLSANWFVLVVDDRILSLPTGELTPDGRIVVRSTNGLRSRFHGIELAVDMALNPSLELAASIDYVHGSDRIGNTSEPADRVPPLSGRLALSWDSGARLAASVAVAAAAEQARLSSRDRNDPRIDPNGTDGWSTVDARLRWRFDSGWILNLGVDNTFDRRYRRHGSGVDATGRNYAIELRYSW